MISNIEPLAREMTERICRRNGMVEADIPGWVDLHWQCAAAMLEAGVMDENGEWITDKDCTSALRLIGRDLRAKNEIRCCGRRLQSHSGQSKRRYHP